MTTKTNRRRGKNTERAVAKALNGTRLGLLGKQDVEAGKYSVEVKSRKAFVAEGWMQQAERNCPQGKTPVVVVHLTNQHHKRDLVMMRFEDWQQLQ